MDIVIIKVGDIVVVQSATTIKLEWQDIVMMMLHVLAVAKKFITTELSL
jgi:hypothetical protein